VELDLAAQPLVNASRHSTTKSGDLSFLSTLSFFPLQGEQQIYDDCCADIVNASASWSFSRIFRTLAKT
jgi:hypothetical protein